MHKKDTALALNPNRFADNIHKDIGFLAQIPEHDLRGITPEEKREHTQRVMAAGALSLAKKQEKEHGSYDLDATLYKLISNLQTFSKGARIVDTLRKRYGSTYNMPAQSRHIYHEHKDRITEFNHSLGEVINAGALKISFGDLLTFMKNMYIATGGSYEDAPEFEHQARKRLVGMRNEIAVEQLLISAGIEYELGTVEQDAHGGDFIIEGIPIDVKASLNTANQAKEQAIRAGRDPDRIMWSHIETSDYGGMLVLPYDANDRVFARFKPELDKALHHDSTAAST